jgi:membrane protease YdiL (CAAX protease family)
MLFKEIYKPMQAIWSHFGGFGKLLMFTLLVFVSFMVFSLLAMLGAIPFMNDFSFSGGGIMSMSIGMLRYFQIVQSFSIFIIPSLLAGLLFQRHPTRGLGFFRPSSRLILLSVVIIVSAQPFVSFLGVWNSSMQLPDFLGGLEQWMVQSEASASDIIYRFLDTDRAGLLLFNLLMIAILPALGEEMLFRGVLQPVFAQWLKNKHMAVFITAFLFGVIHLQFFTFLPRFFLGLVLGYLMLFGKNIWYPVAGHFANNFLSLIVFYYYRHTQPEINPLEPNSEQLSLIWIIASTLFLALISRVFFNRAKHQSLV